MLQISHPSVIAALRRIPTEPVTNISAGGLAIVASDPSEEFPVGMLICRGQNSLMAVGDDNQWDIWTHNIRTGLDSTHYWSELQVWILTEVEIARMLTAISNNLITLRGQPNAVQAKPVVARAMKSRRPPGEQLRSLEFDDED